MPRFMKKSPNALLNTTMSVQIHVLNRRRVASEVMHLRLIAGVDGDRRGLHGRLVRGHELAALAAQRHVFAGFLGEAAALVVVENRLADDAPDDARPEEIFAVETLHPIDKLTLVE